MVGAAPPGCRGFELTLRTATGFSAPRVNSPSVIVPVYNEIATARTSLDAITAKQIPGVAIEVIMVESNSSATR